MFRADAELTLSYAAGKLSNCAPHNVAHDAITQTVIQWKAFMIFNFWGPSCDEMSCRRAEEEEGSSAVKYFMTGLAIFIYIFPSEAFQH